MKKNMILAVSAIFVLMLGIAVYAFNQSNDSSKTAAHSCPMKGMNQQTADAQIKTSCCDRDDCCCKNGSCPMKSSGENASASCCCSNGDACPMKDKNAQATGGDTKNADAKSENCCKGKHG